MRCTMGLHSRPSRADALLITPPRRGCAFGFVAQSVLRHIHEARNVAAGSRVAMPALVAPHEVALIALTAAATFSILDTYIPSMGVTARTGAGFGIGANMVGFPR